MTIIACLILIASAAAFVAFCPRLAPEAWPAPIKTRMNQEREKGPGCGVERAELVATSKEDDGEWRIPAPSRHAPFLKEVARLAAEKDRDRRMDHVAHHADDEGRHHLRW